MLPPLFPGGVCVDGGCCLAMVDGFVVLDDDVSCGGFSTDDVPFVFSYASVL